MEAKLLFSNGETLVLSESQIIYPIIKLESDGNIRTSQGLPIEITSHMSAGLIPSVTEMLCHCVFFQLKENDTIAYNSNSVVKIQNL